MRYIWNLHKGIGVEIADDDSKEQFCIFLYEEDEDITRIEGKEPMVFGTKQDAINRIMVGDWDDDVTIVIRKMNIIIV